jgi:hypothetical protein
MTQAMRGNEPQLTAAPAGGRLGRISTRRILWCDRVEEPLEERGNALEGVAVRLGLEHLVDSRKHVIWGANRKGGEPWAGSRDRIRC